MSEEKLKEKRIGKVIKNKSGKIKLAIACIVIAAVLVAIGFKVYGGGICGVKISSPAISDLSREISLTGNITSDKTVSCFSPISAPIAGINVREGDIIKKGAVLLSYDEDKLALILRNAELAYTQANSSYLGQVQRGNEYSVKRANASSMLPDVRQCITTLEDQIQLLNNNIEDKSLKISKTLADLQKSVLDINQNGIQDSLENLSDKDKASSVSAQQSAIDKKRAVEADKEIVEWRRQIAELTQQLSAYNKMENELIQDMNLGLSGALNANDATALRAGAETARLASEDIKKSVEEVKDGLISDMDAVVSSVYVVEGEYTQVGSPLVSLQSLEDVCVTLYPDEDDLSEIAVGQKAFISSNGGEYEGEVLRISRSASKESMVSLPEDDPKIAVVVKLYKIDDRIIIGANADVRIITAEEKNIMSVNKTAIVSEENKSFVYVLDDKNIAHKKEVSTGIVSGEYIEIKSGLSSDDRVVVEAETPVKDGGGCRIIN